MKVKQLVEVVWKVFYNGRPKATGQSMDKQDIGQLVRVAFGGLMRQRFLESKKIDEFGEPDYTYASPVLDVKEFTLSDPNLIGMRRADMNDFDLYRLPKDGHITNMYPVGGSCGSEEVGKISLVKVGEENFYTKPKFKDFLFAVIKGRGINFYNLPPCVKKVGIETTYNSDDIDITLDMAYDISLEVFNILWKEKMFPTKILDNPYDSNAVDLKHRLQEQQTQVA